LRVQEVLPAIVAYFLVKMNFLKYLADFLNFLRISEWSNSKNFKTVEENKKMAVICRISANQTPKVVVNRETICLVCFLFVLLRVVRVV